MTARLAARDSNTIRVNLRERAYDIEIGSGALARLPEFVAARAEAPIGRVHAVVITDSNVAPLFAQDAVDALARAGARVDQYTAPAGEPSKSVAEAEAIWNWMRDRRADRRSIVIAVGGGVIGDLAGFAAATFARGLAFVQVPTTLLAHVDSSVGGKVGINLPGAKNMVGAFWQPRGVLIDTDTLATLPDREYRSGLAEVVKYGVILDREFFEYLEANAGDAAGRKADCLRHVIARSCRLKADVVEQDEREETGLRAVLNYGHTFGHAIEAVTGYNRFLHGETVAIGMMCAARLALSLGRIDNELLDRQRQLLEALGLPVDCPSDLDAKSLLAAMQSDKKVEHGRLRFVLPDRLGHVELVEGVSADQAAAALVS
jgi:3-dehydroquinate synthase